MSIWGCGLDRLWRRLLRGGCLWFCDSSER